ncbi:MAG: hypothetical protein ACYCWW_15710, partial [Deltaproteobacteria bacterium]
MPPADVDPTRPPARAPGSSGARWLFAGLALASVGCAGAPLGPRSGGERGPAGRFLSDWERSGTPGDPGGLTGASTADVGLHLARLLLARRNLDDASLVSEALEILWRAPDDPAARPASAELARVAGLSTTLDERIRIGLAGVELERADLEVAIRLRELLAALRMTEGDAVGAEELRRRAGLVARWSLVGPLSPYRYLDFDRPLGPELDPDAQTFRTAWGEERWRPMQFSNGWVPTGHVIEEAQPEVGERREPPPTGDVLFARSSCVAGRHGLWIRVESSASLAVYVDGQRRLDRDLFRRQLGRQSWTHVDVGAGQHALWVKVIAASAGTGFRLWAIPDDGDREGPLPLGELDQRLTERFGPVGAMLTALDGALSNPSLALAQLSAQPSPLDRSVRADLWEALGTLGDEEARGRARGDLDAVLAKDPADAFARVRRAGLELDAGQLDDAAADLAAISQPSPRLWVARAKLRLAGGAAALARTPLEAALALDPGYCPALELQAGLLEQSEAFTPLARSLEAQATCPGGQERLTAFRARTRGPSALVRLWRARLDRSPSDPHAAAELAEALLALGHFGPAAEALQLRLASWPEDIDAWRMLGQLWYTAGNDAKAQDAFERALAHEP